MGDTKGGRAARGDKRTARRRAVGTRDRIITHLMSAGDIDDPTGMASTKLAEAVEYPGSSVAFAQLLSGMERDGLVAREVRGKRTYRITLPEGAAAAYAAAKAAKAARNAVTSLPAAVPPASAPGDAGFPALAGLPSTLESGLPSGGGIDYDELARRLLVQVLRKLAAVPDADIAAADAPSALAEENARLREQLTQTQRALELERARRSPLSRELNQADVVVLDHLLNQSGETALPPEPAVAPLALLLRHLCMPRGLCRPGCRTLGADIVVRRRFSRQSH